MRHNLLFNPSLHSPQFYHKEVASHMIDRQKLCKYINTEHFLSYLLHSIKKHFNSIDSPRKSAVHLSSTQKCVYFISISVLVVFFYPTYLISLKRIMAQTNTNIMQSALHKYLLLSVCRGLVWEYVQSHTNIHTHTHLPTHFHAHFDEVLIGRGSQKTN